jgi:hypothetical protein
MSNLILHLENFFSIFSNVTEAFAGNYTSENEEVLEMKKKLVNEQIPTTNQDRANLKNDGTKVVIDYKKAFDIKKEKFHF